MTMMREQVAEEVRALLARRRLSARAAAEQLGWTANYLSRRMTGAAPFDVDDLAALAGLLNVPVTSFFAGIETIPTSRARGSIMGGYLRPIRHIGLARNARHDFRSSHMTCYGSAPTLDHKRHPLLAPPAPLAP